MNGRRWCCFPCSQRFDILAERRERLQLPRVQGRDGRLPLHEQRSYFHPPLHLLQLATGTSDKHQVRDLSRQWPYSAAILMNMYIYCCISIPSGSTRRYIHPAQVSIAEMPVTVCQLFYLSIFVKRRSGFSHVTAGVCLICVHRNILYGDVVERSAGYHAAHSITLQCSLAAGGVRWENEYACVCYLR